MKNNELPKLGVFFFATTCGICQVSRKHKKTGERLKDLKHRHKKIKHLKYGFRMHQLPSLKLTQPLKIGLPNRKLVFQPSIFRGYVSLPEGTVSIFDHFCFESLNPNFTHKNSTSPQIPSNKFRDTNLGLRKSKITTYFFLAKINPPPQQPANDSATEDQLRKLNIHFLGRNVKI